MIGVKTDLTKSQEVGGATSSEESERTEKRDVAQKEPEGKRVATQGNLVPIADDDDYIDKYAVAVWGAEEPVKPLYELPRAPYVPPAQWRFDGLSFLTKIPLKDQVDLDDPNLPLLGYGFGQKVSLRLEVEEKGASSIFDPKTYKENPLDIDRLVSARKLTAQALTDDQKFDGLLKDLGKDYGSGFSFKKAKNLAKAVAYKPISTATHTIHEEDVKRKELTDVLDKKDMSIVRTMLGLRGASPRLDFVSIQEMDLGKSDHRRILDALRMQHRDKFYDLILYETRSQEFYVKDGDQIYFLAKTGIEGTMNEYQIFNLSDLKPSSLVDFDELLMNLKATAQLVKRHNDPHSIQEFQEFLKKIAETAYFVKHNNEAYIAELQKRIEGFTQKSQTIQTLIDNQKPGSQLAHAYQEVKNELDNLIHLYKLTLPLLNQLKASQLEEGIQQILIESADVS